MAQLLGHLGVFLTCCGPALLLSHFCFVLLGVFDSETMHSFDTFGALCLQLDPESMVMALYESTCEICGDGEVRGTAWITVNSTR